jgi:hypothetical protein
VVDFQNVVADIRKRYDCSNTQAMARARREHPELFDAYQGT